MEKDIRWIQRLSSFKRAFASLTDDVELATERELSDIEQRGLIQAFEYTYERAWNIIKDFYQSVGESNIHGSRDAFQLAIKRGLIDSNCGSVLMESFLSVSASSPNINYPFLCFSSFSSACSSVLNA
jgi:hypothetical protein